jgi:hypothetical protein
MITFKQFLEENSGAKTLFALLKSECPQAVKACLGANQLFLRGMRRPPHSTRGFEFSNKLRSIVKNQDFLIHASELTPRNDRNPKHSSKNAQKIFDDYAEKRFGWRPRKEGIFTTSDLEDARFYGPVYAIFPKGDFRYVYHSEVADFFLKFKRSVDFAAELQDFVNDHGHFSNVDIEGGLDEGVEVILGCDSYYAVKIDHIRQIMLDMYDYCTNIDNDDLLETFGLDVTNRLLDSEETVQAFLHILSHEELQ